MFVCFCITCTCAWMNCVSRLNPSRAFARLLEGRVNQQPAGVGIDFEDIDISQSSIHLKKEKTFKIHL